MLAPTLLTFGTLATLSTGHLFMQSPVPIAGSAPKDPLDPSGSNFPCHNALLPSTGGQTMLAGSKQTLEFDAGSGANTAVHGGGSCQVSLTYETDATAQKDPKNWKVIYSIEGGCPSKTYQNLDSGPYLGGPLGGYSGAIACSDPKANGVDCISAFDFQIPKGVRDGHAILAWTWFNTVGNREMYMNCVSAEIEGGDGSEMDGFPTMFVANLAAVGTCPTTESVDVEFPFPGRYKTVVQMEGPAAETATGFPMAVPTGEACAEEGKPLMGDAGSSGEPVPAPVPAPSSYGPVGEAPVSSEVVQAPLPTSYDGVAESPTNSEAVEAPLPTPTISQGMVTMTGMSPSPPAAPTPEIPGSDHICSNPTIPCSKPGEIVCIGSDQWGNCDLDNCVWPMPLAAGTKCEDGKIAASKRKRWFGQWV
ncbi:hypothetical protein MBLNU230_g4777t1 [Neophaeotheca triangularis]